MKYVCISQDSLHGIREAPFTVQNTKPTDGTEGIQTSTVSPGDDEVSQSKGSGSEKKKKRIQKSLHGVWECYCMQHNFILLAIMLHYEHHCNRNSIHTRYCESD